MLLKEIFLQISGGMISIILFLSPAYSQDRGAFDSVFFCVNKFNLISSKTGKTDSAVFLLSRLADLAPKTIKGLFIDAIDNSFIQNFIPYSKTEFKTYFDIISDSALESEWQEMLTRRSNAKMVLDRTIKDSRPIVQTYLSPLKYWADAQDLAKANKSVRNLTESFFQKYIYDTHLDTAIQVYDLKYALLLHQIVEGQAGQKEYADKILNEIYQRLRQLFEAYTKNTSLQRQDAVKVKLKWLFAYANFLTASQYLKVGNNLEAGPYLHLAAFLSPDLEDQSEKSNYFYDVDILRHNPEKDNFFPDYIIFLKKNNGKPTEIQNTLVAYAQTDPGHIKDLEKYYITHNDTSIVSFKNYWSDITNKKNKSAAMFSIKKLDGNVFDLASQKGKWVLLDFWGTWCGPCRAEHPDLNNFYLASKQKKRNIEILTIACRDNDISVRKYMADKKYGFPVAMQQEKMNINTIYPVNGYPSKFLINPEGQYIIIPYGIDWQNFINNYIGDL